MICPYISYKLEHQVLYGRSLVNMLGKQHCPCNQISASGLVNLYNPFAGYERWPRAHRCILHSSSCLDAWWRPHIHTISISMLNTFFLVKGLHCTFRVFRSLYHQVVVLGFGGTQSDPLDHLQESFTCWKHRIECLLFTTAALGQKKCQHHCSLATANNTAHSFREEELEDGR